MWPNTISARALVNAIQRAHKAWRRYSDYFIWSMPSLSVLAFFLHNWTQRIYGFTLLSKMYLRKGNDENDLYVCFSVQFQLNAWINCFLTLPVKVNERPRLLAREIIVKFSTRIRILSVMTRLASYGIIFIKALIRYLCSYWFRSICGGHFWCEILSK